MKSFCPAAFFSSFTITLSFFALLVPGAISVASFAQNVTFTGAQTTVPASGLHCPRGVAVDAAGDVFIADSNDSRIVKVPYFGNGTYGAQTTVGIGLNGPNGVTVDAIGNIFIADSRNNRVVEIPADGDAQFSVGSGLKDPGGVAVDAAGDVFIADSEHNRVVEVPANGDPQFTVGSGLQGPRDVAVDAAGDVFIADSENNRVVEVPADGGPQFTVGSGFTKPSGVALDAEGDVFISDLGNSRVLEILAGGGAQTTLPTSGLIYPYGVALDGAGDVFIVNFGSSTSATCPDPADSRTVELQRVAVNFVNVEVNSSSTLTLNYNVAATTTIGAISAVSQCAAGLGFTIDSGSTCTGTISAGSSCTVNVNFAPTAPGVCTGGEVQVNDSSGNLLVTTLLNGIGMAPSVTTLSSSPNPSTYGEPVTFTAVVSSSDAALPNGGTVAFEDGKTVLGTVSLTAGTASFVTSALKTGTAIVTAAYGGDATLSGSASKAAKQVVKPAADEDETVEH